MKFILNEIKWLFIGAYWVISDVVSVFLLKVFAPTRQLEPLDTNTPTSQNNKPDCSRKELELNKKHQGL